PPQRTTIASPRLTGSETIHRSVTPRNKGSRRSHPPATTVASTNIPISGRRNDHSSPLSRAFISDTDHLTPPSNHYWTESTLQARRQRPSRAVMDAAGRHREFVALRAANRH